MSVAGKIVRVKFSLEQTVTAQRRTGGAALLFLNVTPGRDLVAIV